MSLPERLKLARESRRRSQREMANSCSISVQMWQNYEWGKSKPGSDVLEALSRMGFNVNWILTGEGEIGQEKWPVRVTKAETDPMGRPFEISYDLDELFGARVLERLRSLGNQTISWLAQETKIDVLQLEKYIYRRTIPSVDEIVTIADALRVNPTWLAERSPHVEEHERHERLGKALESDLEDIFTIEDASKVIDKHISEYDYHLDQAKGITLLMTVFALFSKDFCEKREELSDHIVHNLVKLCLPGREQASVAEVMGHIDLARGAVTDGNLDKARIEFMRGAKDWNEIAESGDTRFKEEMDNARLVFTTFVQSDKVYIEGVKTLIAVIKANPGIKQFDLYNSCPGVDRKMIIYILNFAVLFGIIERTGEHQLSVKESLA